MQNKHFDSDHFNNNFTPGNWWKNDSRKDDHNKSDWRKSSCCSQNKCDNKDCLALCNTHHPVKSWLDHWHSDSKTHPHSLMDDWLLDGSGFFNNHHFLDHPLLIGSNILNALGSNINDTVVSENDKAVTLSVAIPGIERKDVNLSVREQNGTHYLDITWHRTRQAHSHTDHVIWSGKTWNSCSKTIPVPRECVADDVEAEVSNGSLIITIPKKAWKSHANPKVRKIYPH